MSIADPRAAWNAVERLAVTGEVTMADDLAALLTDPRVVAALAAVAEGAGTTGGTLCARDAAEQAIEANRPTYIAVIDTAAHDGRLSVMAGPPFPAPGGWTYQDATGPHCAVLVESADRDEAQSALDTWLADCPAKRGGRCYTHGGLS